ncbi:hypothetical protein [Streptosporangium sandarakinum]|uniref:hypothetical protein n=1 Tax=Streptosporangium sandarakinum TaxID=1260955 RepID=UPI003722141B
MTGDSWMDVSHADLRDTSRGLTENGADHLTEVRAMRAYLEGEGDPWGDDELGSMVGAAYRAMTRHALDVYESLAERHVTTGEGTGLMAGNHRSAEQRSEEEADRILRDVRQA